MILIVIQYLLCFIIIKRHGYHEWLGSGLGWTRLRGRFLAGPWTTVWTDLWTALKTVLYTRLWTELDLRRWSLTLFCRNFKYMLYFSCWRLSCFRLHHWYLIFNHEWLQFFRLCYAIFYHVDQMTSDLKLLLDCFLYSKIKIEDITNSRWSISEISVYKNGTICEYE